MVTHRWIRAAARRDRDRVRAGLDLPPTLAVLDAHRRLRGPYTAGGSLIRRFAADLLDRRPDLGVRHNVEILTSAPELKGLVPGIWTTLEWQARDGERTRFYSRLHTRNIANGIAELLRDYVAELGAEPCTLVVENAHQADPTDQELVAVLLRRGDLGALTVVVGTGLDPIPDPPGEDPMSLTRALSAHAVPVEVPATAAAPTHAGGDRALAQSYVDSDGTDDDPAVVAAYQRLPQAHRAALHDRRAEELRAAGEFSLLLGAVPYHAERGTDPGGRGAAALKLAMDHCRGIGLYQATVDLGLRGRALVDRAVDPALWWEFSNGAAMAMATLGRADEAESIYVEGRAWSIDPAIQLELAYATAMLHARHYPESQRDYIQARAWMNLAIALASGLPDPKERAFRSVFSRNGLALVEVRQKRPAEALRLLENGMAWLDRELGPDEHRLHRTVLVYNRGQVYAGIGRLAEALEDYTAVAATDPDFPEHHFNIGVVLRRMGRTEEAIAAYQRALELSPPFPEAYYNLGEARLELGDVEAALADFSYVIELDPNHVEARLNLAELRGELGQWESALADVTAALALAPENAKLLCLKGKLLAERGEAEAARQALAAALRFDGKLGEAWAIRGGLAYESGDLAGAIDDLERAVACQDLPEIRYNRAVLYEEAGRYAEAIEDYDAVLTTVDDDDARERRDLCRAAAGHTLGV
jgi:tetratricopeptide (TPR) repeat protein